MASSLVEGSNNPPVDVDDNDSTAKDIAVTIDVAANNSDPDGNLDPASANTTCATCSDPNSQCGGYHSNCILSRLSWRLYGHARHKIDERQSYNGLWHR